MAKLNITKEQVNTLYSEAGSEMNYCDQVFTYDKEILVTQQYRERINSVLTAMEVNFKPAEFQVGLEIIRNFLTKGRLKKKTIESVIIPRRNRVKVARSIWSLILKIL